MSSGSTRHSRAPNVPLMPGDQVSLDANGLPVVIRELGTYQTAARRHREHLRRSAGRHVRTADGWLLPLRSRAS